MSILVHFQEDGEGEALCARLRTWMELSCVSMEIIREKTEPFPAPPVIVFWDLDGSTPPPSAPWSLNCGLFLCSQDPQRAIDSYSFHPTGFLTKPITMDKLWNAMLRCAPLWFPCMLRLEILSDRVKIGIPFQNLLWVEGTRRGCMLHTSHQSLASREPLYRLEQRLPQRVFIRCQRSFLVNLLHVREIAGSSLYLNDGTEISLGRGNKADVTQAYRQFCRLRYEEDVREGGTRR